MNKQPVFIRFHLIFLFGVLLLNCSHDPLTPLGDAPVISFKADVQPLMISNCTESGCHGQNGHTFPLVTYNDVFGRVSAGQPHSSRLYVAITANVSGIMMPPSPAPHLTDTEIKTIYLWIAQGANNN